MGKLSYYKCGRMVIYKRDDLDAMVETFKEE